MSAESVSKIKYLKLWDILRQETDEEHPMTTPDLLARLDYLVSHFQTRAVERE